MSVATSDRLTVEGQIPKARLATLAPPSPLRMLIGTSQMGTKLTGDPRELALRDALYLAVEES
jgi:hypothetical protein